MAAISPENPRRYAAGSLEIPLAFPSTFDNDPRVLPLEGVCFSSVANLGPMGTLATVGGPLSKLEMCNRCCDLAVAIEEFFTASNTSRSRPPEFRMIMCNGFDIETLNVRSRAQSSTVQLYNVLHEHEAPPLEFWPEESEVLRNVAFSQRFFQEVRTLLHRRTGFLTAGGHVGVGRNTLEIDDRLYVFPGAETPLMLRRDSHGYLLMDEAYVHQYMDQEALTEGRRMEVFCVY